MNVRPRLFGYLGVVLLVTTLPALVFAGAGAALGNLVEWVLTSLASVAYVIGGFGNPVRERVGWFRAVGLGNVLLGLSLPATAILDGSVTTPFGFVLAVGGLGLVAIGVDYIRGGKWTSVDTEAA